MGGGVLALLVIAVLLYFAFRYAKQLLRPLGEAGSVIFLRLSAFIMLCLGVQIVWDDASELLRSLLAWTGSRIVLSGIGQPCDADRGPNHWGMTCSP